MSHEQTAPAMMALPPTVTGPIKAAFDALYQKLIADWNALKTNALSPQSLKTAWQYVENSILQFVGLVDAAGIPNTDKATAVLAYVKMVYENAFLPMLPIYLKPEAAILEGPLLNIIKGAIESAVALWHQVPIPAPPVPIVPVKASVEAMTKGATGKTNGPNPIPHY